MSDLIQPFNYFMTNPVLDVGQENIMEYPHETGGYSNGHSYYNNYYYTYPEYISNQYYSQPYNANHYEAPPQWHRTMEDRSPSTESHVSSISQSISSYNQLSPEGNQSTSITAPQEPLIEVEHSPQLQNLDECVDPLEERNSEFCNLDNQISQSVNFYDNSVHYDDNCAMMNNAHIVVNNKHFEKENEILPLNEDLFSLKNQEMYQKEYQPSNPSFQNVQTSKLFNAIKNKKSNLKIKRERKRRSSPHELIPYVTKDDDNYFICTFDGCGFKAKRRSNIIRHMEAMHEANYYICCRQLYPTKSHFETHRHHAHSDGMFQCVINDCRRLFNRKSILHKHEDMCHSCMVDCDIICSVCLAKLPHPGKNEELVKCHAFLHSSSYFPSL